MAGNDAGFPASDVHGELPRLPADILGVAHQIAARNAEMFREAAPPPFASAHVGVNAAPSSGGGVVGAAAAAQHAPGVQKQGSRKRRVVVCKTCGAEGHMAKTCGRSQSASGAAAPARHPRQQAGGAAASRDDAAQLLYEDEEEDDVLPEDADDLDVEIECYKFQPDDFTWQRIEVPSAAAAEVERDLRSGHHAYAARDIPKFKLGAARCKDIPASVTSAWDFLGLLLTDELIDMLVVNTNKYARCSVYKDTARGKDWRDVDTLEMKLYLSIVMYMGVVQLPSRAYIFDRGGLFGQEWVFSKMSKYRFNAISRCLHSDAPFDLSQQDRERLNKDDPFWQIDKFCEELCSNFMRYWIMGQCADLDECSCGYRGKHKCRCFNPLKPDKYHFKMFSWNCAETGYCFCFYWYRGKEEHRPANVPATLWPVMKLTEKVVAAQPRIVRNNFILTTDNWYTSLHEAIYLARHGIHCCGTLRPNRVTAAQPPDGAIIKKTGAPPRGTMVCHQLTSHLLPANWNLFMTAWVDNKPVHVLHTWPTYQDVCERNCKQAGGQRYMKKLVPRPTICKVYNKTMGGTDLADFFLSAYATSHRAKRWQPRILFHCIQLAVVNAHIIYRNKNGLQHGSCKLLDFITLLLQQIAPKPAPTSQQSSYVPSAVLSSHNRSWWSAHTQLRTQGQHFPDKFSRPRPQREGETRQDPGRKCIYCCRKKVLTFCKQCGVYLCIGRCFHEFHTHHNLNEQPEMSEKATSSSENDSD
jgi:hypothetical protein